MPSPLVLIIGAFAAVGFLAAIVWYLAGAGRRAGRLADRLTLEHQEATRALAQQIADAQETSRALRESEARWRQIVETEPECVSTLGLDGSVQQLNEAGLRIFEASAFRDVAGMQMAALVSPEHREEFQALTARVARGESGTCEFELTGLKGTRRWLTLHAAPLRDERGAVVSLLGISHDISDQRRTEALLRWEKQALELIMRPGSLAEVLDGLMLGLEANTPGSICSVLLLDDTGTHLLRGGAPSLPPAYNDAIHGIAIGPRVGSCGTAAHLDRQIIVPDIATDPLWSDFRDLALAHGLRACWSTPVHSDAGKVLGTFAIYYREPRLPSTEELEIIDRARSVVAIAIMRKQAEAALARSRERLELALEGGDLGIWEWYPQTGRTGYSARWARMLEYTLDETEPNVEFFKAHLHPEDLPEVLDRLDAHLSGRTPTYQSEHRMRTKSGAWKWVLDRGSVVARDAGGPQRVTGVIADITARKEAEAALVASQQRHEVAMLGSSDGLWDWDMRSGVTYFAPRWKAMLGYDDHELANDYATWERLIHPDDLAATKGALQAYIAGSAPHYAPEFRMQCKDGSYKWILARGAVLRDEAGQPFRMAGSHTDITERRRSEEALRSSQQMIATIIDTIPVRVFWKDRNLVYLGCNTEFAMDAGFASPVDVIGRDDYQMAWRRQAELYRADDMAVLTSGEARLFIEEPQTTADGRTITLLTSKVPLRNAQGEITGVLGTYLDITTRKQAEEEVRRLNAELEDAVRARTAELRDSEAQLRDLFDGTSELVQSVAPDGTILFTNRAWRETLGYDSGAIAAMNIFDVIHPDHREHCAGFLRRLIAGEEMGVFETVMVARDGRACELEGSVTVGFEDGRATVTRGIFRDVTARKAMDRALRESEEQHRLMIQSSRDAILTLHPPDWRFTSCNPAAIELFGGTSEAQICALEPWELSPPLQEDGQASPARAAEFIARALETGSHFFEWTHQRINGSPFFATVLLSRVVQGGQTYLLATIRDVTVQKHAETAMLALNQDLDQLVVTRTGQLRESEERFRHLVDSSPNAVLMTGPDGTITFANRRVSTIFGYEPAELVGHTVELLLPEAQRGAHVTSRSDAFRHTEARAMGRGNYLFARRKDGTDVAVEVGLTPIEMSGGRFMMATVTDVTARKRAEEAVKRLAAFPEVNPNPVMELTGEGVVTYTNAAATSLSRDLGLADPGQMLPGDTPAIVRECLATSRERLRLEQRFGKRVLSWSFYPIAGRGVVHGYAADITERLTLEDQLRQSQKMEAIGQLAGGVAHDFNNILSVVMMQAEVSASAEGLSSEALEGLQEIQACAERGADLTRQLLLFSRRQVMQPKNLNLNEVVTTIAKMLQRIIGEDVSLELHLHTARLATRADAGMLDQVLLNLAVNARDAMPKGGRLRVETWEEAVADDADRPYPDVLPGRYVGMSVSDTGTGIPPEVLPRIFEPFFTTKEAGKGTGLGLATVFGIVRQHGGWVTVASEPGQGTTFRIFLPAIAPGLEQVADRAKPQVRGGTETVLVVEDEPSVRMLVRAILQRRGYTVIEASSGVEALKLWDAHRDRVSLVLTDLVMPDGVSGQELARRLRADMPGLRVVFSSGYSAEIAGRELKLGVGENFLQKPFSADTLSEIVRRALDTPPAAA